MFIALPKKGRSSGQLAFIFVSEHDQSAHISYEIHTPHLERPELLLVRGGFPQTEEFWRFDISPFCDEKTVQDRWQVELGYSFEKYIDPRRMVPRFNASQKQLAVSYSVFPNLKLTIRDDDEFRTGSSILCVKRIWPPCRNWTYARCPVA